MLSISGTVKRQSSVISSGLTVLAECLLVLLPSNGDRYFYFLLTARLCPSSTQTIPTSTACAFFSQYLLTVTEGVASILRRSDFSPLRQSALFLCMSAVIISFLSIPRFYWLTVSMKKSPSEHLPSPFSYTLGVQPRLQCLSLYDTFKHKW